MRVTGTKGRHWMVPAPPYVLNKQRRTTMTDLWTQQSRRHLNALTKLQREVRAGEPDPQIFKTARRAINADPNYAFANNPLLRKILAGKPDPRRWLLAHGLITRDPLFGH